MLDQHATGSWDDFRILLAVAGAGSFAEAGRELGVATSTAARRIAAWERRLGARLVDRRSSGVMLTEAGAALLTVARDMQTRVNEIEQAVLSTDASERGTVRISVGDGMGEAILPALLELRGAHPHIEVEVVADARVVDLARREADLAIRSVQPRGSGLLARKLGHFRLGLYAAPAYLERRSMPRRIRDLARHDIVGLAGALTRNPGQRWLHELGVERTSFRAGSVALAVQAVHGGLGIGAVSHAVAAGLCRVFPGLETAPHPVWLVRHRDTRGRHRVDTVARFLDTRLRALSR